MAGKVVIKGAYIVAVSKNKLNPFGQQFGMYTKSQETLIFNLRIEFVEVNIKKEKKCFNFKFKLGNKKMEILKCQKKMKI